jgi:hypothetical protein
MDNTEPATPTPTEPKTRPATFKDRALGAGLGIAFASAAVCMFIWPNPMGDVEVNRGKSRLYLLIADWLWSPGGGVAAALLAIVGISSAFDKTRLIDEDDEAKKS